MEQIIENAKKYAKDVFANDFSGHDWFHTERVYKLATTLAQKENADIALCQLAALLHDVDDRKLSKQTYENKDNARKFLKVHHVEDLLIEKIITIIDEISFMGTDSKVPSTIEGKCVQDADRLDAIGAIGIARTFAYGGSKGNPIYDPEIKPLINMNAEQYKNQSKSTVINHFYEKLLLLEKMMNTDTAKAMARNRTLIMEEFLNEFFEEWNGKK